MMNVYEIGSLSEKLTSNTYYTIVSGAKAE